ncbi:GH92 family glycosyl hydrolase [Massilibacteroides sp.]|uniref:GH92 family glycosyl hydrolase n=1 Tax=Massilibacteroides sp. TaxID=2034766 RepID=UPI0026203E7C|nr:GH92 family glycosyl hydrolase [Massilibacteroides sp.]MDD4515311.1 GH92 family glycosyl hydrolase [Massilibacteroides sp.]
MKRHILIILPIILFFLGGCNNQTYHPETYVNPLIGTDIRVVEGKDHNSTEERGQVMPAVGVPHGMTNWVAQTQETEQKCHPPYYYFQDRIQGFRASHWMNGSCTQDYGSVTIMPLCGQLKTDVKERSSAFSHEREVATPSYYRVFLDDYKIESELTGLSRSAIMRFSFTGEGDRFIVIEPNSDEGLGYLSIDVEKKEITGYNPVHRIYQGWGMETGFSGHFVIRFEDDFEGFGVWEGDTLHEGTKEIRGNKTGVGGWVKLASDAKDIQVKVATSFTNVEHALENLQAEIGTKDFEQVRKESSAVWNETLGKVIVKGGTEEQKTKFYTALYSTRFLPRTFSDVDGSYPRFDTGKEILKTNGSTYYCDFSQWDTYRAVHPLFTILDPKRNGEMANSLVLKAEQGGWLPIFPSWNSYTAAMIGDHCTSMLGDAIIKNIPDFDYEKAYNAMRKNAFEINMDSVSYKDGKGRRAMASYLKYNYIPLEDEVLDAFHKREQVSRTLEYAYDDFVLAQVAKKLGKMDDYELLIKRAQNYRNVIDTETGYARGRYADGSWFKDFDPNKFVSFICEGTPYHYTWYVPQDVAGLIDQIGGKERFISRLDTFFEDSYYWHGNEPGHHISYLYAYAGEPWKTQKWVHDIINTEYFTTPDGHCGNEDAGQMSAWLVFSMIGFYPLCPGMPYYVIGSPTFEESVITLENGKIFTIRAKGASDKNIYIQSAQLNGKEYNKSYILHKDIMNGGELSFVMGDTPNKTWGNSAESIPPSLYY